MHRKSVDFPQPLRPVRTTTSPFFMKKEIFCIVGAGPVKIYAQNCLQAPAE